MYVIRDFLENLKAISSLEIVLLWGPRQVGKTTLLHQLSLNSQILLDDLGIRLRAQSDPGFVLEDLKLPCLIDEAQLAPNLFPEMKLRIDKLRLKNLKNNSTHETLYYLTGSNKLLLDKGVKESLAGRCSIYTLHGLSLKEILQHDSTILIRMILLKGGFPELYARQDLPVSKYLNDYITSFIEKDIAQSAGIQKIEEFHTVLRLLAARTGQFININNIANDAGVEQKTVQSWISILQMNHVIEMLPPFSSNLSKRITKMKKLFFYDTGLCARLQGHSNDELLWGSPQAGSLFETLVFSEIIKTRDNFLKEWQIFTWRTKEQSEIDFILQYGSRYLFIESELGIHGASIPVLDREAKKVFKDKEFSIIVVTSGGEKTNLDKQTTQVPIKLLADHLLLATGKA